MSKIKFLNWEDACRTVQLKSKSGHFELKATNSLFAKLLIIAKSSWEIDLEDVILTQDFAVINLTLMNSDGSLIPCINKIQTHTHPRNLAHC